MKLFLFALVFAAESLNVIDANFLQFVGNFSKFDTFKQKDKNESAHKFQLKNSLTNKNREKKFIETVEKSLKFVNGVEKNLNKIICLKREDFQFKKEWN